MTFLPIPIPTIYDQGLALLTPAYGRDYHNVGQALAAWEDGRDFRLMAGSYCSNRDRDFLQSQGYSRLVFCNAACEELGSVPL